MSIRTESLTKTDIFCDVAGCKHVARGPCAVCGKDICAEHSNNGELTISYKGHIVLLCPEDSKPVLAWMTNLWTYWHEFQTRQQEVREKSQLSKPFESSWFHCWHLFWHRRIEKKVRPIHTILATIYGWLGGTFIKE